MDASKENTRLMSAMTNDLIEKFPEYAGLKDLKEFLEACERRLPKGESIARDRARRMKDAEKSRGVPASSVSVPSP